jgi:predicted oxidoreductase
VEHTLDKAGNAEKGALMNSMGVAGGLRPLGRSELSVSPLGWGMWRFRGDDVAAAQTLVEAALDSGITLFDTADIYGPDNGEPFGASEALLGRVFKAAPGLRSQMVLATKGGIVIGIPYHSRGRYLIEACEASLRRLGVDSVDLYQIHRPDILAHPAEVAAQLETLKAAGKIRAAGVSNHTPAQTAALQAHLSFPLASIQPEFSALAIDGLFDGTLDQALQTGMAVLAWSPLGQGRLGGDGVDARSQAVIAALDPIAARNGVPRSAVAYAWCMMHPARPIPLVGSQTAARIREAAAALTVTMSDSEWYGILVASRGAPMP